MSRAITSGMPAISGPWMACAPAQAAARLARLRLIPGLELALENRGADIWLWLRGRSGDTSVAAALRSVSGAEVWEWAEPMLRRSGDLLPRRRVPEGLQWHPFAEALPVSLPVAAMPGDVSAAVRLRLVRSGAEQSAALLLTSLALFAAWAETAPEIRLERLTFAAADDGRVIVRGTPLPPVEGEPWLIDGNVAVPCGLAWEPAVSAAAVHRASGAGVNDLVLLSPSGIRVLAVELFVPARRAAVRASVRNFQPES